MVLRLEDIGKSVRDTQYAVRGPIVVRAAELERAGREIIYCNIGNPQALGQKPLTFIRQVLALCEYPELIDRYGKSDFPSDVVELAHLIAKQSQHGLGAYTESKGMGFVREAVAQFIAARDGISADPETIFLTDGASKGVQTILRMLIADGNDGIMIPIPQYPLYSATITLYGGKQIDYHLDEAAGWKLDLTQLEESYQYAKSCGVNVRALCVINPGNPTGAVLDEENIAMVIEFARRHSLTLIADEVYQENIYLSSDRFCSFASVLTKRGITDVSLFSFHSCSKGFLGECGHRGGYFECRNVPKDVLSEITKMQSVALCANSVGQVVTYLMVRPPCAGEPSHSLYVKERDGILKGLRDRAQMVAAGLNKVPGICCQQVAGSMYAFPQITLPEGMSDGEYCMRLLENTGICVVPGSGFGQRAGTFHFRTTILPPTDKIAEVVHKIADFHVSMAHDFR